jgi:hypothetical protein
MLLSKSHYFSELRWHDLCVNCSDLAENPWN